MLPLKTDGALLYDSDLVVDFLIGKLFYIASIQFNGSAGYIIETGDQADQSGFSASGTTDDTDCLPFFLTEKLISERLDAPAPA